MPDVKVESVMVSCLASSSVGCTPVRRLPALPSIALKLFEPGTVEFDEALLVDLFPFVDSSLRRALRFRRFRCQRWPFDIITETRAPVCFDLVRRRDAGIRRTNRDASLLGKNLRLFHNFIPHLNRSNRE